MKRSAFCFCLAIASVPAFAHAEQPAPILPKPVAAQKIPDSAALAARYSYIDQQTRAMQILASWAVASVATGTALWATGGDDYTRAVGVQNVAWGAIDGIIAGIGYRGVQKERLLDKPATYWQAEEKKMRKIFFINMGLDVLYVTAGALMVGLGKNDSVRGAGAGVMLQGSFLFTFDGAMGFGAKPGP
jgi:hypothetical protein